LAFVGAVVAGATGAFFSDTETSTGNTFTAGAIDLTVDNHAWYNGIECAYNVNDKEWRWTGSSSDPYTQSLVGTPCTSSWGVADLGDHLFFNFDDLKPGDWEEDTISLHVNNNDAWMCGALTLTSNDDNDVTEPEGQEVGENDNSVDDPDEDAWDGELASALNFIFWADDGDNVLESDEPVVLSGTPADLETNGYKVFDDQVLYGYRQDFPIADSYYSIYGEGPITGEETVYIGKAFCFGSLSEDPVTVTGPEDQAVNDPADDPGFDCSGELVSNITQTDSITGDLEFSAVQSRNNEGFRCDDNHTD